MLYQNGVGFSRDEHEFTPAVIAHIVEALNPISDAKDLILDGELYVHGWSLQDINGAVAINRKAARKDTHEIQYQIFDCVTNEYFDQRYLRLFELFALAKSPIKLVKTQFIDDKETGDELFAKYVDEGYEGIMYRDCDMHYQQKRSNALRKRKGWQDDEFPILSVIEGEGKRTGMVGAFVCQARNGSTFRVGTGLGWTNAELTRLFHDQPINQRLTVKYITLSRDGIPQNPSAQNLREHA